MSADDENNSESEEGLLNEMENEYMDDYSE